ncbi:MAG: precorrin-8X methylmutase [Verrucomicrobia bacterium]|nr:precorrin-8X methylmutase [Verrucomicrobiota bacterium]
MITPSNDYSIVVAGHGSRDSEGVSEFEQLVELVRQRVGERHVQHGFLEFARPTIDQAARSLIEAGDHSIAIVPMVLLAATHAKNDLPSEVLALQQEFPATHLHYGPALHLHPNILRLFRQRIVEAEARSLRMIRRADSCLVVAGRGTTDPDANSDVSKLARLLQEGMGFGGSYVCYSGTAKPLVAEGLEQAVRLGFERIVVAPFFLFTGVLVKRIYAATDSKIAEYPGVEFLKADYLGVHQLLADAFLERAAEAVAGKAAMNCSLCKYRVQIVGYEKDLGAPQQPHHLQVRAWTDKVHPVNAEPRTPTADRQTLSADRYVPHPIEEESFRIIEQLCDWNSISEPEKSVLQRLIHTSGDPEIVDDIFISPGAVQAGIRALSRRAPIVTDVTMVQSGLRRGLLQRFGLTTVCTVHDEETGLLAESENITRSAAGIRRAWNQFGNNLLLAIGDAPTAVEQAVRLVLEQNWRPYLIIGLPVGFVGTRECKEKLRTCLRVPRITNRGTRGGSPWAAAVVNAMLIHMANRVPQRT